MHSKAFEDVDVAIIGAGMAFRGSDLVIVNCNRVYEY